MARLVDRYNKEILKEIKMKKLTAEDTETKSPDLVAGNIDQLKALFPEAFTEGKVDFEVLKHLLGGTIDEREEKYGLNWVKMLVGFPAAEIGELTSW